jgi:hypothetical protein
VLLNRFYFAVLRVRGAVAGYWKRIAVGAFLGWLVSTVVGAFALVAFESADLISMQDSPLLGAAVVWMGTGVGACVAYVARPQPLESEAPSR